MLFSLMYHHINGEDFSNDLSVFEKHLEYLVERYRFVVPGDNVDLLEMTICLTFDDAYYDFYRYVFPLLKKYQIRALLAVPTGLIAEATKATTQERLSLNHTEIYQDKNYQKFGTFCTWDELREMHESGWVVMASHSHKHKDLSHSAEINLYQEVVESKAILEEKLGTKVESFVLPFGRYDYASIEMLQQHYKYIFKVGQGLNSSFSGVNGLIYRIDADNTEKIDRLFTIKNMAKYTIKSLVKMFYDGIKKKRY